MRPAHRGLDGGGIDLVDLRILGVRVGVVLDIGALAAVLEPGAGQVVDLDKASLATCLDGHVGHGETALHAHGANGAARELHGRIQRTVDTDHADDVQDDVLARHARGKLAVNLELEGGRHLEPGTAGG